MAKEIVHILRSFEYDSYDVAYALKQVTEKMFGQDQFAGIKPSAWRPRDPVSFTSIKVGPNQNAKVVTDLFRIKAIDGDFQLDQSIVQAVVSKSEVQKVEGFLDEIKKSLEVSSIYKGKAVTSKREFMDLSKFDSRVLVYNSRVSRELKENLWVLLEKTKECRVAGVKIQRKVLFEGRFGTGKTMAILATAKKAIENGFTVFYLEPTAPDLQGAIHHMLELCKKYQPAFLAIEDFD